MAGQEGHRVGDLLPDPADRRHRTRHHRRPGHALGRVRRQRRPGRPHALFGQGARGQGPLQSGRDEALAVRRQAVHAALLFLEDPHGLQQEAVRGGRPGRSTSELRSDPGRRDQDCGDRGRPVGLHHAQLRLAVLGAVRDERGRAPERRHDQGGVQHASHARCADQARQGHDLRARSTTSPGPAAGSSPTTRSRPATSACTRAMARRCSGSPARPSG